jgi:hypothetical protein
VQASIDNNGCTGAVRTCKRSGEWSGASRKTSERERSGERDFRKKERRGSGSSPEREIGELERRSERAISSHKFP